MPVAPQTRSGQTIHERILLYGGPGVGKTRALLAIAKWHQARGSDATFYVISNDLAYERMLAPGGDFGDLENVVYANVSTMAEYIDETRAFNEKIGSDDWLSLDLMNGAWEAAQDEYAEKKWGTDLGDYWLTMGGEDHPIEGWDWGVINKRYRYLTQNLVMRCKGHVMCMSGEAGLREASKRSGKGGETREITEMFGRLAVKPQGQKDDPFRFHTVIHLAMGAKGKRIMVSAKDRERELMQGVEVGNFWNSYLVKYAGWKP